MGQRTKVFWGTNPSQMYMDALVSLVSEGKELAPRGKKIKELRPVVFEYHNPTRQVTFLRGRAPINPFFQLAESLWILSGGSDVRSLLPYNASIAQFSDDGEYFNAPYGERLRHWGKNDANNFIFCPIDQLEDCFKKLKADVDTRQAVGFIGNPQFDSSEYTLKGGKDIACNLNIKFKIRDGALDVTVDNRSNDLHWGVFGANLCQFSTIQMAMAAWLGIPVGVYTQVTDSLHIYLDAYGYKETEKILKAYGRDMDSVWGVPSVQQFIFPTDPVMNSDYDAFHNSLVYFYEKIEPSFTSSLGGSEDRWLSLLAEIRECTDPFLRLAFQAMFVKHAHNAKNHIAVVDGMDDMADSQWRVACLRFLFKGYGHLDSFQSLYSHYEKDIKDYIERKGE